MAGPKRTTTATAGRQRRQQSTRAKSRKARNGNSEDDDDYYSGPRPVKKVEEPDEELPELSESDGAVKKTATVKTAKIVQEYDPITELEERVVDNHNDWETESYYEDVIGSGTEDRFFTDLPYACTTEEALEYRRLLRAIGPNELIRRTVDSGEVTAKKLLTAFNVRPPEFLEGARDEEYLPFLTTAFVRELRKRAKLTKYNTIDDAVELIRSSTNIIVLTGAGISTSLGIPDFRSKDIGLYSKLGDLGLADPQEVFDIELFRHDPTIFYSVARDILPQGDRCTPTHAFIGLLQKKGKLLTNYTQNIDNLEAVAGISPDKLVQCHGSFSTASCIMCHHKVDGPSIFPIIRDGQIPRCPKCASKARTTANSRKRKLATRGDDDDNYEIKRPARPRRSGARGSSASRENSDDSDYDFAFLPSRGGILKPDITFFGEELPREFGERLLKHDRDIVDLVIVIGTSLKVAPVSEMVPVLPPHVPQIYIGREAICHTNFDIDLLGDCDVVVAELCRRAGWDLRHEMVDPEQRVRIELARGYYSRHRVVPLSRD